MNAREHYDAAEKCLATSDDATSDSRAGVWLAKAQVHATLALAAATGRTGRGPFIEPTS